MEVISVKSICRIALVTSMFKLHWLWTSCQWIEWLYNAVDIFFAVCYDELHMFIRIYLYRVACWIKLFFHRKAVDLDYISLWKVISFTPGMLILDESSLHDYLALEGLNDKLVTSTSTWHGHLQVKWDQSTKYLQPAYKCIESKR